MRIWVDEISETSLQVKQYAINEDLDFFEELATFVYKLLSKR